jgi:hypothetical protein
MTYWKTMGCTVVASAALLGMGFGAPQNAEALDVHHGRTHATSGEEHEEHEGREREPHFGVGLGYGPYWAGPYWGPGWWGSGWRWGPYWGSYLGYPPPEGRVHMGQALAAGYGAIKIDAKPKHAEVWADGNYIAEARDLDGTPSYLWLKAGEHDIQLYQNGYVTFDRKIDVHAGMRTELRVHMDRGPSVPPGPQTAQSR